MRIAWEKAMVPWTTKGEATLGRMWRRATEIRRAPSARTASTYSFSRSARTGPRMTRAKSRGETMARALTAVGAPGPRRARSAVGGGPPGRAPDTPTRPGGLAGDAWGRQGPFVSKRHRVSHTRRVVHDCQGPARCYDPRGRRPPRIARLGRRRRDGSGPDPWQRRGPAGVLRRAGGADSLPDRRLGTGRAAPPPDAPFVGRVPGRPPDPRPGLPGARDGYRRLRGLLQA